MSVNQDFSFYIIIQGGKVTDRQTPGGDSSLKYKEKKSREPGGNSEALRSYSLPKAWENELQSGLLRRRKIGE